MIVCVEGVGGSMPYLNNDNVTFQQRTHKTPLQEVKVRTKASQPKILSSQWRNQTTASLFSYPNSFCITLKVLGFFLYELGQLSDLEWDFSFGYGVKLKQANYISGNFQTKNSEAYFPKKK